MANPSGGGIVGISGHGPPRELLPSELEEAMRQAWREAGAQTERGIPRACMLTLVGHAAEPEQAHGVELALDTAAVAVPSRVILLVADPKGPATPKASFGTNLHVKASGSQSVYSEEIHLRSGPAGMKALPGLVWGLRMPDLPLVGYWPCCPPGPKDPLYPLLHSLDRLVVDSLTAEWRLPEHGHAELADLDWSRHEPWRRALAGAFEGPQGEGWLKALDRIRVVEDPTAPGHAAAHLASWLATRMGWREPEAVQGLPGERSWRLKRPHGPSGLLMLVAGSPDAGLGRLLEVELEGRDPVPFRLRLRVQGEALHLDGVGPQTVVRPLRPLTEAELLGQVLQGGGGSSALTEAMRTWGALQKATTP